MKKLTSILLVLSLCTSLYGCSRMGTNIYNGLNNKRLETKSTGLDNTCINWFFIPNNESRTPDINDKLNFKLSDYDAIYNGPKSPNVKSLYLTFDEGYENGYTEQILDVLKEKNVKIVATALENAVSMETVEREENMAFILGNEGQGVSKESIQNSDICMRIDMNGFESLNVGVAGGIIMYKYRK